MPFSRRLTSISKLKTKRKKALIGIQVRWLSSAIIILQQLRFIKFHTRARSKSLDRLTVETSFILGYAIFQALPVKIGSHCSPGSFRPMMQDSFLSGTPPYPSLFLLSSLQRPLY